MKKTVITQLILLIAMPLLGLFSLIIVFLLPVAPMRDHLYWSADSISKEFSDELVIDGYEASLTGNFTDSLMLHHSIYKGGEHSLLDRVLKVYRSDVATGEDEWLPGVSLVNDLNGASLETHEVEYSRYWHGYLVIMKPLLLIFSFSALRLFNSVAQLILLGACLILMTKKSNVNLAFAFLASMPFMFFVSTFASFSLSICFYITMFAVLFILIMKEEKLRDTKVIASCFLVIGMLTAYFDFLTYPLVTICYPLGVCLYLNRKKIKESMADLAIFSVEWGIGYIWMWASKWVISDILTDTNTIKDALSTVLSRTRTADGGDANRIKGFMAVIKANFDPYANWGFAILLAAMIIIASILIIKNISKIKDNILYAIPFVVIALFPFIWWFLAQNHSEEHYMFSCRIFAAAVFAKLCALGMLTTDKKSAE